MTPRGTIDLDHYWFRKWPVACLVPCRHLNRCLFANNRHEMYPLKYAITLSGVLILQFCFMFVNQWHYNTEGCSRIIQHSANLCILCLGSLQHIWNIYPLLPYDTCLHYWNWSTLLMRMACHLLGSKSLFIVGIKSLIVNKKDTAQSI